MEVKLIFKIVIERFQDFIDMGANVIHTPFNFFTQATKLLTTSHMTEIVPV